MRRVEHGDYLVDIFNMDGQVVDQKPRRLVDKTADCYNGVHVLVVTPWGELVISHIPSREELPNLYADLYGTTLATIRRSHETAEEAAHRALKRTLFMDPPAPVQPLGEAWTVLSDGRKSLISAYQMVAEVPVTYNNLDIAGQIIMMPDHFEAMLAARPERFAPTLQAIWEQFGDKLRATA